MIELLVVPKIKAENMIFAAVGRRIKQETVESDKIWQNSLTKTVISEVQKAGS
jgi:hypothetical protein